jgi:hypothetical protein
VSYMGGTFGVTFPQTTSPQKFFNITNSWVF